MKQLKELEAKVLDVIQKNNELSGAIEQLRTENSRLRAESEQLKDSLLRRDDSAQEFVKEKESMRNTVEELIKSINSLEV